MSPSCTSLCGAAHPRHAPVPVARISRFMPACACRKQAQHACSPSPTCDFVTLRNRCPPLHEPAVLPPRSCAALTAPHRRQGRVRVSFVGNPSSWARLISRARDALERMRRFLHGCRTVERGRFVSVCVVAESVWCGPGALEPCFFALLSHGECFACMDKSVLKKAQI